MCGGGSNNICIIGIYKCTYMYIAERVDYRFRSKETGHGFRIL